MNPFDKIRYIEIETHSACTRKCNWCLFGAHPNFRPKEQQFLNDDCILNILYDLREKNFCGVIGFFSINEPLLDQRIVNGSLFRKSKQILGNSILVSITTNGDLLNKELLNSLFASGLDFIKISCYEMERYKELNSLYKDNEKVILLDQTRYNRGEFESNRGGSLDITNLNTEYTSCFFPQYRIAIGWDGEVRICYHDVLQRIKIGNVKHSRLSSILNSKYYVQLVHNIQYSRQSIFPCSLCNVCGDEEKFLSSNQTILRQLEINV